MEVQRAARRVAEEIRQLRHFLHRHGFDNDYINRFLRTDTREDSYMNRPTPNSSTAVRDLRQALMPRRLTGLYSGLPLTVTKDALSDSPSSTKLLVSSAEAQRYPPVAPFSFRLDLESHLEAATTTQFSQQQQHQYFPAMRAGGQSDNCPEILSGHAEELGSFDPAPVLCQSMSLQYGGPTQYSSAINSSRNEL